MNPYLNRVEDTYSQRNLLVQRVADAFDCGAHEASAPRLQVPKSDPTSMSIKDNA